MSIAKSIEISSESTQSFDHALKDGIARASRTVKNIQGVWIKDQQVVVDGDSISKYRLHLKVTFVLDS